MTNSRNDDFEQFNRAVQQLKDELFKVLDGYVRRIGPRRVVYLVVFFGIVANAILIHGIYEKVKGF